MKKQSDTGRWWHLLCRIAFKGEMSGDGTRHGNGGIRESH